MRGELRPRTPAGIRLLEGLAPVLPTLAERAGDHDGSGLFAFESFDVLRRAGALAGTVPEEFGGGGLDSVHDVGVIIGRVGRADASVALGLHMQLSRGITLQHAWRTGTGRARGRAERLLAAMGRESAIVCGAVAERGAGYAHVETKLERAGDGWVLNGRKTFGTLAAAATHFVVRARAEVAASDVRIASALVRRDSAGIEVVENWDALGMRASGSNDVVFADCRVPDDDVELHGPWGVDPPDQLLGRTVSSIGMLAIYVGIAESAREIAATALRCGRGAQDAAETFGRVESELFGLQSAVRRALEDVEALATSTGDPFATGPEAMGIFQCAKLLVNRRALGVVDDCMSLVGGASYSARHPLARLYRDVRAGGFMQPYPPHEAASFLQAHMLAARSA